MGKIQMNDAMVNRAIDAFMLANNLPAYSRVELLELCTLAYALGRVDCGIEMSNAVNKTFERS